MSAEYVPTVHHPTLYDAGRHGAWATCACGWKSPMFTTVSGAHIAFGAHLAANDGNPDEATA